METSGCGDAPAPKTNEIEKFEEKKIEENDLETPAEISNEIPEDTTKVTSQMIEDQETKLKDRIEKCRNVIDSLKTELFEEKTKLKESKQQTSSYPFYECEPSSLRNSFETPSSDKYELCYPQTTASMYSACVESKLGSDDSLMEYEKQLEQYQNTLTMAQITKKQAIRKQMLAKAFRLKLLEVENQCNIELLRVKQSLQCLEPLQLIADKWKTDVNDMYAPGNFQLTFPQPEPWSRAQDCPAAAAREDTAEEDHNQNLTTSTAVSE